MKRINLKHLAIFFILILSVVLTASSCVTVTTPSPSTPTPSPAPATPSTPINPAWTPPSTENQTAELPSIADVVAVVKPSVVAINTEVTSFDFFNRPYTQEGAGSGWILDKDGIIVTNNHVVAGAKNITVTMDDGRTFNADTSTVFTDPLSDLAIFKIDALDLPVLNIGDSSKLRVGDWVVAIGNALGQGIRATEGIISREGVSVPVAQGQTLHDLIETSAAINPGNSGGPLVNLAGEVIGITSAKLVEVSVEGVGYAISSETAIPIIEALIKNGYVVRPWLGVASYTVDQFVIMRYDLPVDKGVLITEVVPNSPAAKAGLEAGDIVVSFDGKEVVTVQELVRTIHSAQIGRSVEVTFQRGDAKNTTSVILEESPAPG